MKLGDINHPVIMSSTLSLVQTRQFSPLLPVRFIPLGPNFYKVQTKIHSAEICVSKALIERFINVGYFLQNCV